MKYSDIENQNYLTDLDIYLSQKYKSRARLRQILKIYQLFGILIAAISIIYFIITSIKIDLSQVQLLSIIIGGSGLVLSLFSKLYTDYLETKSNELEARHLEIESVSEYIFTWTLFEKTIKKFIISNDLDVNIHSLKAQIEFLYDKNIISDKEFLMIERALEFRNIIIHEGILVNSNRLNDLADALNNVIEKIQSAQISPN